MSVFMEFPVLASFRNQSHASLFTVSSKWLGHDYFFRQVKVRRRWSCELKPVYFSLSSENYVSSNEEVGVSREDFGGLAESVEVIGIGSRKDAVLDFCLDSSFQSSSMRFWNIVMKDTMKVQLQQRFLKKDVNPRIVEASLFIKSRSKAIILVASAGYGLDHIAAIDIMNTIKSTNGYAIAIVLNPFSFEGRKRKDEVRDLLEKLEKQVNFFIDIDADKLLEKELVTLDEASKTANNAVLLAINAISVLVSDAHRKYIDIPPNNMKELEFPELLKILDCYKEAKIGFGVAHDIKTSIIRAIFECPFISIGTKDMNGVVICILATSSEVENIDVSAFLHVFRQTTEYTKEIVISTIQEPNLEPNLLLTTVVVLGCREELVSQKSSIFSKLAQRFPFVFNLLRGGPQQQLGEAQEKSDDLDINIQEPEMKSSSNNDEICVSRDNQKVNAGGDSPSLESFGEPSIIEDQNFEGNLDFQEQLISRNLGPGYQIAQEWAKERACESEPVQVNENQSPFHLPVGVRSSNESKEGPDTSITAKRMQFKYKKDMDTQSLATPNISRNSLKVTYESGSTKLKGKNADPPQRQGRLSARAASMLEAERDKQKKWSPVMEIQFRGGVYKGRCQGGLPEGKGRLILDGSIYEGMWRCGKKCGSGTFYFSNGDVFQGSWRDDLMHGKGWFYFHNGHRWFANFWKGKANGEGRFYSKNGDIFFGHFQDGWRHGRFLCIDVDGARYAEIWDEGVLISREQLELPSDTD